MGTRTITTVPVLGQIRIDPTTPPHVYVEGQIQDTAGNVVQAVAEDIYPALTATQQTAVNNLIAKVTARLVDISNL